MQSGGRSRARRPGVRHLYVGIHRPAQGRRHDAVSAGEPGALAVRGIHAAPPGTDAAVCALELRRIVSGDLLHVGLGRNPGVGGGGTAARRGRALGVSSCAQRGPAVPAGGELAADCGSGLRTRCEPAAAARSDHGRGTAAGVARREDAVPGAAGLHAAQPVRANGNARGHGVHSGGRP